MKTPLNEQVIETCYFLFKNAVIDQNQKDIKFFYENFLFTLKMDQQRIKKALRLHQLKDLKSLLRQVKYGTREFKAIDYVNEYLVNVKNQPVEKEIEIRRLFEHKKADQILSQLGYSNYQYYSTEFPVRNGFVDAVVYDKTFDLKTALLFELKKGKATYHVVGQIQHYINEFDKKLMYKHYEQTQGIVVASAFSRTAYTMLKSLGVRTVVYQKINNAFTFKEI